MQQKRNKRKPKEELLSSISDSIILLLNHLYPVSEQLRIINKTLPKNCSVSEKTYLKYLKTYLKSDYIKYKKNIFIANNMQEMIRVILAFKTYEEQFENFKFKKFRSGNSEFNLSVEDYIYFFEEYFEKEKDIYIKK
ncbi:hypothetical protein CP985_11935 [Malaciobacter mytili LMG 24559]|uniref:Uncharacterized protein n=1 Tax=Malaciobacter mytili LMG 24559 TaxID=1032238 RepID=A0AAX2ADV5_9BACT|nr:hypothetical protein [Malaciobacter mytili]AXH15163.1 hypothetical protein AMYT_1588 [Malaciobacter mytili LMG 24559]RXK14770.1 hypothetical protein CP985_11935 [Malaciobacter mytili LMG 24559]